MATDIPSSYSWVIYLRSFMSRPLLLIVDAESIKNPGLISAMEGEGWVVRWIRSAEAQSFLGTALLPDLVLLEPSAGAGALGLVRALRVRKPQLPLLMLAEGPGTDAAGQWRTVEVQAYMDPKQSDGALVAALRRYFPDGAKLTTEDIFGDMLADLNRPAAPPPDPFDLFPHEEVPAEPVETQAPLSAVDVFAPVVEEVAGHPAPADAGLSNPAAPAAPDWTAAAPSPAASGEPEPLGPSDFTLSGISGVNDPFEWAAISAAAPPGRASEPAPRAEASSDPESIEEYGNYFLLEKIAVGGMAELFKAQQRGVQGFQKIVAIKRILPHFSDNEDFVTMFIDEAKLAAQLTHPNIVQIFDLGKAGSSYYIAMEYVNGRDLRTLLRKVRE
jgi:hypothetical protein